MPPQPRFPKSINPSHISIIQQRFCLASRIPCHHKRTRQHLSLDLRSSASITASCLKLYKTGISIQSSGTMAWWHETSKRKPHRQSSSSSSSSTEIFAALRTPPPRTNKSRVYSGLIKPALGKKDSFEWGYFITVIAFLVIIIILSRTLKRIIAKLVRQDAAATQDGDNPSQNEESSSIHTSTSTSQNCAAPSSISKRGLDRLSPRSLSLPFAISPAPNPDTEVRKDIMTVDENVQAYIAQNGENGEGRPGMSEAYARRKRREQEGYLVGF